MVDQRLHVAVPCRLPDLQAASLREAGKLADVARQLAEHGRSAIWVATDLLEGTPPPGPGPAGTQG